ncbi:MAG: rhodanese-like domain-containing protein [Nevskiales bacterium]
MNALLRITPEAVDRKLRQTPAPLLLDARRSEAFRRRPEGIADAIPVLLDESELRLPDAPRDTAIVVYCLCDGQASSTRVALRLQAAGYTDVAVLEGGLPGWQALGLPLSHLGIEARERVVWMPAPTPAASGTGTLIAERAFLTGAELPLRRHMAVLFVDMVDSTRLFAKHSAENVLRLVQAFMQVVAEVAVQHCGDVHDFEGDGAMLYFAGVGEALPAAFDLRRALAAQRHFEPELPQARFALDAGPLVIGYIGSTQRRSLAFIGPSVNTAARILKFAPPDGIVATESVIENARRTDPDLAGRFQASPERQALKGFDAPVAVYLALPESDDAGAHFRRDRS